MSFLQKIAHNIWTVPQPLAVFGFIHLQTRMTVIQTNDKEIILHSSIRYNSNLAKEIDSVGKIKYIIAPNNFHHLFAGEWCSHYPEAELIAPKGLAKKRPDLPITTFAAEIAPDHPIRKTLDIIVLQGVPVVQESLFYHKESQTLIVTDTFFYLPESTGFTSFYASLNSVKKQIYTPLLFLVSIKDKSKLLESLQILRELPIEHVSLCHHAIVSTNAKAQITAALDKL